MKGVIFYFGEQSYVPPLYMQVAGPGYPPSNEYVGVQRGPSVVLTEKRIHVEHVF